MTVPRTSTAALLLSLLNIASFVPSPVAGQFTELNAGDLGGGDFPPLDDTTTALLNCCEAGCEQACDYTTIPLDPPQRRKLQSNPSGFPLFELPPPGPDADLDIVNANCCNYYCRDSGCGGDPHFSTWTGDQYDFHGQCDMVLLDAPDFGAGNGNSKDDDSLGLTVHIRTRREHFYSYIESAAIRIGKHDILEVASWGEYKLNGVDGATMPNTLGPFEVTLQANPRSHKDSVFEIDLGSNQSLVVRTFKSWVSIDIKRALAKDFQTSKGLMGDFQSGHKIGRYGKTVIEDNNLFGQEWQVRPHEPKLFDSKSSPQYPEKCLMPKESWPSTSAALRRALGEGSISKDQAKEACAHVADNLKSMCIFDVIASNDKDMAGAY